MRDQGLDFLNNFELGSQSVELNRDSKALARVLCSEKHIEELKQALQSLRTENKISSPIPESVIKLSLFLGIDNMLDEHLSLSGESGEPSERLKRLKSIMLKKLADVDFSGFKSMVVSKSMGQHGDDIPQIGEIGAISNEISWILDDQGQLIPSSKIGFWSGKQCLLETNMSWQTMMFICATLSEVLIRHATATNDKFGGREHDLHLQFNEALLSDAADNLKKAEKLLSELKEKSQSKGND